MGGQSSVASWLCCLPAQHPKRQMGSLSHWREVLLSGSTPTPTPGTSGQFPEALLICLWATLFIRRFSWCVCVCVCV